MGEKTNCCFRLLLLSLGFLSVLLLVTVGIIVWVTIDLKENKEMLVLSKKENQRLNIKKSLLENVTTQLIRERDDLRTTLEVILSHDNFPVNEVCPDKKCLPCQSSWMSFLERCGLFHNQSSGQNTWKGTGLYCQNASADLVFTGDLKEQNLPSNHEMNFCSLGQTDNHWFWFDGHNESIGFWMTGVGWYSGPYATVITWWKSSATWFSLASLLGNSFDC